MFLKVRFLAVFLAVVWWIVLWTRGTQRWIAKIRMDHIRPLESSFKRLARISIPRPLNGVRSLSLEPYKVIYEADSAEV